MVVDKPRRLEVFFDYACPYCLMGHHYLTKYLELYPNIEVVWRPCEAHPRPEQYGRHSDLCIQGMYYAQEQGVDLMEYHTRMYNAAVVQKANIENPDVVAGWVHGLMDTELFREVLRSGRYEQAVVEGNDYAYRQSGVWAVPAYRMDGKKLDSIENVGITYEQLAEFLG
jgi:predicted DsbA family dithiol-disulfide isomerase